MTRPLVAQTIGDENPGDFWVEELPQLLTGFHFFWKQIFVFFIFVFEKLKNVRQVRVRKF